MKSFYDLSNKKTWIHKPDILGLDAIWLYIT